MFFFIATTWLAFNLLVFDNSIVESIFSSIFFGVIMTAFNIYSNRKWGSKMDAEAERMKALKNKGQSGRRKDEEA